MNATSCSRLPSRYLHAGSRKKNDNCYANLSNGERDEQHHMFESCQAYVSRIFLPFLFDSPPRLFFLSFILLFFILFLFFLLFWKAVSLNPIQFLSAWGSFKALAPWSGPSILSPTSRLFKRAKAQRCSFLNTQIHPSTNRGTAVWQKSLSLHLSSTIFPHLGLWHSPPLLSLPTLLHIPHPTSLLPSLSLSLPFSLSLSLSPSLFSLNTYLPLSYNLSFVASLALTHPLHPSTIIYRFPSPATSAVLALHPALHPSVPCLPFLSVVQLNPYRRLCLFFLHLTLDVKWLMPSLGSGPSFPTAHAGTSHRTQRGWR